jgi:glycosyltransferase involved in cell wall biosynthesis
MLLENDLYPQDVRVRYEAESLVKNGYSVRVLAPRGPAQPARESINGVNVRRFWLPLEHSGSRPALVGEYAIAHTQLWCRAAAAVLRHEVDVIHVHNPPDTLFPPALLSPKTKLVFDQHDLFPQLFEEKFGGGFLLGAARRAQRMTVRFADLALATNESQRALLVDAGAAPEQVVVVRNAISADRHGLAVSPRPGSLTDPEIVYVGAMGAQDGVGELADVLEALVVRHGVSNAHMTIIGYGEELEPLRNRVAHLRLEAHATFTGRLDHKLVLEAIAAADICIDPAPCNNLNHRTTMVKVVEYLSLGRPTVAYALKETERTTRDAAVLAPCGDRDAFVAGIIAFLESDRLRAEYSARAQSRARDLSWEHSEAALLEGYERMLGGTGQNSKTISPASSQASQA